MIEKPHKKPKPTQDRILYWGTFGIALLSLTISIFTCNASNKNTKTTNDRQIESLLNEAFDLIGGDEYIYYYPNNQRNHDKKAMVKADRLIDDAFLIDSKHAWAHQLRAAWWRAKGIPDKELEFIKKGLELNPKSVDGNLHLGHLLYDQGKENEALDAYQLAIKLNPDYAFAHCGLANLYYKQKKYEESYASYQKASKLDPDMAEFHHGMGASLYMQKKYKEGIIEYKKAIQLDPNYLPAQVDLKTALKKVGLQDSSNNSP